MASTDLNSRLMSIPLELRHHIFAQAALRNDKPKKLFRRWFEKKEIEEIIANERANNPNGPIPVPYADDVDSDSDLQDVDPEEASDGEDNEDEDDVEDNQDEDEDLEGDMGEEPEDQNNSIGAGNAQQTAAQLVQNSPGSGVATQVNVDANNTHQDVNQADMDPGHEAETEDGAVATEEDEEASGAGAASPGQVMPPPPAIKPHHKWRHIPKFLRITHCPPPTSLLMACKDLNREALDWYYNVAVLRIDATGSFAHTSMFEEALNQITDAAFSPMENIRKVEVKFVWDTEWLRSATGVSPDPFEAMLRLRAMCVVGILHRAPQLQEVTIQWYDSICDTESTMLRLEIVDMFDNLMANLAVEEHYLDKGEKPVGKSVQGQRRIEFQAILDGGCQLR